MVDQKKSAQWQYLEELSRNLQRVGFEAVMVESEGKLTSIPAQTVQEERQPAPQRRMVGSRH